MSVYKHSYRPYTGATTSKTARFGVLMRYAFYDIWSSRITNVIFVLCLVPMLISLLSIYIMNNDAVRALIDGGTSRAVEVNERFFLIIMQAQYWPAIALTAWVGPRLIAGDVTNDAMPIILSHPISRVEYVLAKLSVLLALLSAVTWVPVLLLFAFQSHMSSTPWAFSKIHIAVGMFLGAWLWIAVLSMLALAVASWVKWRIVGTGMVIAALFVPAGVGSVFNTVMRTDWGYAVNIPFIMMSLWRRLLHVEEPSYYARHALPTVAMLAALCAICFVCALAMNHRIRAREVVRG